MQQLDQFRAGVWLHNAKGEQVWVAEGLYNDYDGYYGAQCMDWCLYWEQYLGLSLIRAPSALDTWSQDPSGYNKIANGPTNVPEPGDIVVWGSGMGQFGHIAIIVQVGLNGFTSSDQNWYNSNETVGSPAALVTHSYASVLGWFHPIIEAPKPPKPQEIVVPLDGHHHFGG